MFEQYVEQRAGARRSRRRIGLVVAISVTVHAAAAGALFVSTLWHIEKLDADLNPLVTTAGPGPALSGPPPAAAEERASERAPRPDETVDATEVEVRSDPAGEVTVAEPAPARASGASGGAGGSGSVGVVTGLGDGGGGDDPYSLDTLEIENPCARDPEACLPEEPELVPERILEGHRVSGETWIPAPEIVRVRMLREDVRRIRATIEICIDRRGRVSRLRPIGGSGYPEWDRKLVRAMRGWRYRPYRLESGRAVPACGPVTFVYTME